MSLRHFGSRNFFLILRNIVAVVFRSRSNIHISITDAVPDKQWQRNFEREQLNAQIVLLREILAPHIAPAFLGRGNSRLIVTYIGGLIHERQLKLNKL